MDKAGKHHKETPLTEGGGLSPAPPPDEPPVAAVPADRAPIMPSAAAVAGQVLQKDPPKELETPEHKPPRWVLPLELSYVAALVALLLLYLHADWLRSLVPDPLGPIPLAVPWWGALGAVMISLTGIFTHARQWLPSYEPWHIARPLVGAVVGTVGYLIFISVIRATGVNEPASGSGTGMAVIYLVAFIVGYREELFRQLIKRAADLLFAAPPSTETERDT